MGKGGVDLEEFQTQNYGQVSNFVQTESQKCLTFCLVDLF